MVVACVVAMLVDSKLASVANTRLVLNSMVAPIQYMAGLPSWLLSTFSTSLATREQLLADNQALLQQYLKVSGQLQRLKSLEQENERLRSILGAPIQTESRKMVAEVVAVDNNPFSHQVLVNRGSLDDVYLGQPVLSESGVVGQVVEVAANTSRVLMLSDLTHAIPVRTERTNVRYIASGSGELDRLVLEHVAHSADLETGDLLLSSGLGEVFPDGYPVGTVARVERDETRPFSRVTLTPAAQLDRLKYLLFIWGEADTGKQVDVADD